MTTEVQCTHVDTVTDVGPVSQRCEECAALGDDYPAARSCTVCGFVGCCDGSKNHHMINHFRTSGHPIIRPLNPAPGEDWMWCYVDETYVTT